VMSAACSVEDWSALALDGFNALCGVEAVGIRLTVLHEHCGRWYHVRGCRHKQYQPIEQDCCHGGIPFI